MNTYVHVQILRLQRMLSRAEADRDELQAKLSLTTASNRSAAATTGDTTAFSKGDGAGVKVLQSQLRDSEKKCAALLSSNTMLESELDNYKKYIQKVVQRYQETVQQLQAELKAAKGITLL
jgi:vacuolar-type H+-ATPase subunit D/Vma8